MAANAEFQVGDVVLTGDPRYMGKVVKVGWRYLHVEWTMTFYDPPRRRRAACLSKNFLAYGQGQWVPRRGHFPNVPPPGSVQDFVARAS